MGLKVATTSFKWPHPSVPHSPSSSQTLASAISSPSSKRRSFVSGDGALFCRYASSSKLHRSRSCDNLRSRALTLRRALSASMVSFSDEEFSKQIQELALRFQQSDDEHENTSIFEARQNENAEIMRPFDAGLELPVFPERDVIIPANIERKANSFEIPFSLRIIKRKKQWKEGVREAGESAYCSIKKAFSSMVFIIQELHSYTLQMREVLFYEDLQGILARVQNEMNASFVWLFQQVFSHTPTLMVYVMILLANYSVYSMASNPALAAKSSVQACEVSVVEDQSSLSQKFDSSIVRTLKLSTLDGKTTSIGGNNGGGGGGKYKPIASDEDDGRFDESNYQQTIVPDGGTSAGNSTIISGEESGSMQQEEVNLWNSVVEEASRMKDVSRDETLDQETIQRFILPVDAKIEAGDQAEYLRTELLYQTGLAQEPNNSLFLANYAQFLYIVIQDFDRAENYFKKAVAVEPKDAEALNKYANFLWLVRGDLWAAEETYQEAIAAEPSNPYYAGNYAHFLWNTGGEDTCFPLGDPDSSIDV